MPCRGQPALDTKTGVKGCGSGGGAGGGVGRVVSQPGTGLMCEYSLNFSELSFSSTPAENGAGSVPQMGSGDKGDLNRVPGEGGAVPSSASLSCTPTHLGVPHLGSCPGWLFSWPATHPGLPSVCQSLCSMQNSGIHGQRWPQLRSGSPGASPSPGGDWLCPTLCWYKRKLSRGGEGSGA